MDRLFFQSFLNVRRSVYRMYDHLNSTVFYKLTDLKVASIVIQLRKLIIEVLAIKFNLLSLHPATSNAPSPTLSTFAPVP